MISKTVYRKLIIIGDPKIYVIHTWQYIVRVQLYTTNDFVALNMRKYTSIKYILFKLNR